MGKNLDFISWNELEDNTLMLEIMFFHITQPTDGKLQQSTERDYRNADIQDMDFLFFIV